MQAPRGSALVILAALGMGFSRPAATLGQQVAQAERLRYAVQIAAFADADRADAARMQWATPERPIYVTPVEVDGRIFHRVLAGLFSEREEAEALMAALVRDGILDDGAPWHIRVVGAAAELGLPGTLSLADDTVSGTTETAQPRPMEEAVPTVDPEPPIRRPASGRVALGEAGQVEGTSSSGSAGASEKRPVSAATTGPVRPTAATYDGASGTIDIESPWVAEPAISVDGVLDEPAWENAALLTGFTQFEPSESIPATQRTEVLLLVSNDAILFGIRAFDAQRGGVRATVGERDKFGESDDYVQLVLDTFKDSRQAYVIMVNPFGVQQDGLWVEGRVGRFGTRGQGPPIDWNPDFVWESEGQLHDWGYVTEVKIPFKSIRFPKESVQDWGIQVIRRIARNGYRQSWAPIIQSAANQLTLAGSLNNLEDLERGLFLELNPVVTGTRQGTFDSELGALTHEPVSADFGGNVKYGITSNLTFDGTYNPDFSQVEADAGQIRVNERFALFLEEKRPFFLEGTEIFSLPKNLVYTRTIVNPVAGAKLTGKVGSFQAGYLGAVDEVGTDRDRPVVNVLRVRRDLGAASNLGAVFTDRTLASDDYNRVVGVDGRFVFKDRYTFSAIAAGSRTDGPEADPETGTLLSAAVARASRNFVVSAELEDIQSDFRAGSGFIPRLGETQFSTRIQYYFNGEPGGLFQRIGPGVVAQIYWDHDDFWRGGGWEEMLIRYGSEISLRNNITMMWAGLLAGYQDKAPSYTGLFTEDGQGGQTAFFPAQAPFEALFGFAGVLTVNTWDRLRGRLHLGWKEDAAFDLGFRVPVEVATGWNADLSFNAFPTENLSAEIGFRHQSLYRKRDGSRFSLARIPRIKTQYQLNRALFVRAIFEYASQERGDLLHPITGEPILFCETECIARTGSESNDFGIETLLSYEPTPGTVFFLGYSRQLQDAGAFRFREIVPQADGLFVKLSYRFRM
ncbi:MAG: carbohydrate binding family 9 domain-containing protein [Gemmatimonadota bacterium]|nr:carbohydrate binding family 9 domain-containing protein [Gemmatimonadota bacterium]